MNHWLLDHRRGLRWLRRHRPVIALRYFERALETAPVSRTRPGRGRPQRRRELAAIFYHLAVALRQAGLRNRAVGSWVESTRLIKRGRYRRRLTAVTNEYGMARQAAREADDQHAFYGVQLARYLRSKQSHRLGTRAEIDMVADLIDETWRDLRETIDLAALEAEQKLMLFRQTLVVFPFISVPEAMKTDDVAVDFHNGRRVGRDDRCVCGSGLAYKLCHGRTPGSDEALIGKF
jgi:hypothetical protein